MYRTVHLEDNYNESAEPIKVEVRIHTTGVFVSAVKDGQEIAAVSLELYDGQIVGFMWDEARIDRDQLVREVLATPGEPIS